MLSLPQSGLLEEVGDIASVRIEWGGCALPAEKPAEGNPGHPGGGGGQGTQQGQEALADVGDEVYDDDLNCLFLVQHCNMLINSA